MLKAVIEKLLLLTIAAILVFIFVVTSYQQKPKPSQPAKVEEFVADPQSEIIKDTIDNGISFDIKPHGFDYEGYILPIPILDKRPKIAIVIDDMGINHLRTKDINSLEYPLTSSYLTYGTSLHKQIGDSIKAGHEIIAHVPMEAKVPSNVAPDVLTITMNEEEVAKNFGIMLGKFENIKGINNHMGSLFTEDKEHMSYVMKELQKRGLFFLDSKTSAKSVGKETATEFGVKYAVRNVFIDNENNLEYVLGQLAKVEELAYKNGYAIAIGHPKSQTYEALKIWLPTLEEKGIKLVHLSEIVEEIN